MRIRPADSLAFRVIGFSTLWAIAALVVVAGLISTLYERTASRGFEDLLVAQLYNLVNSVTATPDGFLSGSPDLGDLRYSIPLSGWYWEVLPAGTDTKGRLASVSLGSGQVDSPTPQALPFGAEYRRSYMENGLDGERLRVVETEVVLDSANHAARFRVMGNASLVAADVEQFNWALAFYLGLFGLGSALVNALTILLGLRPLVRARRALAEVRAGRAERLRGHFPREIRPLAVEMNALIDNNRRIVERARTQVGNLAHSLKTPIAVLLNEAAAIGGDRGRLVAAESERMRVQVQHYLDRARLAAQSEGSSVFRTPVKSTLEPLIRVIAKLNPGLDIALAELPAELAFAGEKQDYEEVLGNLLDNAAKWARTRIRVAVAPAGEGMFATTIEDDGGGLDPEEIERATTRGWRLDETKPGTGLGLSIVKDTVAEYRGIFTLTRSSLGGLKAIVVLPLVAAAEAP